MSMRTTPHQLIAFPEQIAETAGVLAAGLVRLKMRGRRLPGPAAEGDALASRYPNDHPTDAGLREEQR